MRVLIDTNILISAILSHGTPFNAYVKAVTYPNQGVICEQNIDEMRRIFNRKFPQKIRAMEKFLVTAMQSVEIVRIPSQEVADEKLIRDINDRPIYRASVYAKIDIILTGDKDFLEAGLDHPKVLTAAEFLQQ